MPAGRVIWRLSLAEVRPYGAWASPITAASLAEGAIGVAELRVADGRLYWLETRPAEGGRLVIMTQEGVPGEGGQVLIGLLL